MSWPTKFSTLSTTEPRLTVMLNAATRLDDRAGGRALVHDLAPVQGIVGKAQRDAGIELLLLHLDQGLRQLHAPHVGHHRLLGAAEREEEGREARDDHEGDDRPEAVGDEPIMLLVEGLDLAEVDGKGGEADFGQLGQLWSFGILKLSFIAVRFLGATGFREQRPSRATGPRERCRRGLSSRSRIPYMVGPFFAEPGGA